MPPERQEALATIRDGDARLAALFARLDEEAFVRKDLAGRARVLVARAG